MNWLDFGVDNCSIARTLDVVGERWTLLVLREAFNGVRRFDDVCEHIGISRGILTQRLSTLVDHGILERAPYQESGSRTRYEYRLTPKGRDLFPILVALLGWGDRYRADPAGPPVLLEHRDCGRQVQVGLHCAGGHQLTGPREVVVRPGPSAQPAPKVPDQQAHR
jgi:DNA-binding HxlR family transcriptional regulator